MNVLHVSTPSTWRGGEQQIAYLASALFDQGIHQTVLCPAGSALSVHLNDALIPIRFFSSRGPLDLRLAARIANISKEEKYDIIHVHDSHAHSAAVISAAWFGVTIPIVVSRRVDFPVSGNFFSRWKYNHPSILRIICVSEMIRRITAPAIRDISKLRVVHSGIDLERYAHAAGKRKLLAELGLTESDKLIGNLSALADHKDYPTFLKTAALVCREDHSAHFVIAGSGPEEEKIKNLILAHKLQNKVHLLGFRKDVVDVMQSLDIFLITSTTEGLGTIVLEAFAAGVPVVATRAGGIPELVEDEVTGLLAAPGDSTKLHQAIQRILQHPDLRQSLIQNALKKVQEFSYTYTAEKTLAIYREVLSMH